MNLSLLKDLQEFKKRSVSTPTVESKKKSTPSSQQLKSKPHSSNKKSYIPKELLQPSQPKKPAVSLFDYKTVTLRSKNRFSVLATIVDFMKKRHQERQFEPLGLDEILDKIKYTDISPSDKNWLSNEALKENTKLSYKDGKYVFKPKFSIKDKKSLLRLLEKHDQNGLGGILLDDVRESLPGADDIVKALRRHVIFITRPTDKKIILYHNDSQQNSTVDEEFVRLWNSTSVEGLGENDIDRYLTNAGITTMQDTALRSKPQTQKRKAAKRKKNFKILNDHLDGNLLKDYSEVALKGK